MHSLVTAILQHDSLILQCYWWHFSKFELSGKKLCELWTLCTLLDFSMDFLVQICSNSLSTLLSFTNDQRVTTINGHVQELCNKNYRRITINGPRILQVIYSSIIKGFAQAKQAEKCFRALEEMEAQGEWRRDAMFVAGKKKWIINDENRW